MYASTAEQRRDAQVQALAGQLYDAHRGRLLAIARRNCEGAEQAEEALQDAFRRCFTLPSLFLSLIKQSSLGA